LIATGIKRIVYYKDYKNDDLVNALGMINQVNPVQIKCEEIDQFDDKK